MKEKGILLPIFSLPTKYGIGDFGHEAYEFVDILSENGMTYWNLLPICANNNLPYSPTSYFALEEDYISLDLLKEEGLIKDAEIRENKDRAVYDDFKEKYYKEAYSNFEKTDSYYDFIRIPEIMEYAEFIKETKGEDLEYTLFLQYILYKQWMELKQYANSKNVKIIQRLQKYYLQSKKIYSRGTGCPPLHEKLFSFVLLFLRCPTRFRVS